ncbi:hypothetical protein HA152_06370 [Prochlorococcus marinus XMU1412]|uniref:hypothetical protein n=1 Tax=Prochlorococcus marinus TaxID=1219 RepID=UPI001ADB89AE|nr:hypothetical protein [Prochlorococcus marinus]MBO8240326.1 hypothetical protein [Prochlorococcus marinus XMU1412]
MKHLLLPLLAALALPTAVNAERNFPEEIFPEEIYLACKSSSQLYPYLEVAIKPKKGQAIVYGIDSYEQRLSQSSGSFNIVGYELGTGNRYSLNINRFNGLFRLSLYNSATSDMRQNDYEFRKNGRGKCKKVSLEERAF